MTMTPAVPPAFILTEVGVQIAEGVTPTLDAWIETMTELQSMSQSLAWWVGDMMNIGQQYFGDASMQALTGLAHHTTLQYAWVARQVAPERRRPSVGFSLHEVVAAMPPSEQDHWLEQAESEGLTRVQLKARIKADRALKSGVEIEYTVVVTCADLREAEKLVEAMRVKGRNAIIKEVKHDVEPL